MADEAVITIPSSDGKGHLAFRMLKSGGSGYPCELWVDIVYAGFRGSTSILVFDHRPTELFDFIDAHWRGWDGAKNWEAEGLVLSATSTSLGKVRLNFELSDNYDSVKLSGILELDPSSIQHFASRLRAAFNIDR